MIANCDDRLASFAIEPESDVYLSFWIGVTDAITDDDVFDQLHGGRTCAAARPGTRINADRITSATARFALSIVSTVLLLTRFDASSRCEFRLAADG
jgi:hypothetical protein